MIVNSGMPAIVERVLVFSKLHRLQFVTSIEINLIVDEL
jgi:hypothetical protein